MLVGDAPEEVDGRLELVGEPPQPLLVTSGTGDRQHEVRTGQPQAGGGPDAV